MSKKKPCGLDYCPQEEILEAYTSCLACAWNKEYDKNLQLFANILFDKEMGEQFFKECKAMGIEPQAEREGE
jgi:hypothetical protein